MKNTLRQNPNPQHRRDIMKVLLWITMVAGGIYASINFTRGVWLLGVLELCYVAFAVAIYRVIDTTEHVQRWILAYMFPLFFLVTYAIFLPNTSDTLFTWILIIPVLSYLLLGSRLGLWFSIFFVVITTIAYQLRFFSGEFSSLHSAGIYNIALSSIAITVFAHLYERNREITEAKLLNLAGTDQLTRLPNRLRLVEDFHYARASADRADAPLCLAIIDLDHFKIINDTHGHDIGDRALVHVADMLRNRTREVDLAARLGGEEFLLVMPGSSAEEGRSIVDRLRKDFLEAPLKVGNQSMVVTFSAGIAEYGVDGGDFESLVMKADQRLYLAKNSGRNKVVANDH